MKDDSGTCAVFTEQGSSASQMTAAKVMDVIARLPDCAGQAADAKSSKFQQNVQMPKSWENIEDSIVPLERNFFGHPLAGSLWERQFEVLLELGWENTGIGNVCFVQKKTTFIFIGTCGRL